MTSSTKHVYPKEHVPKPRVGGEGRNGTREAGPKGGASGAREGAVLHAVRGGRYENR